MLQDVVPVSKFTKILLLFMFLKFFIFFVFILCNEVYKCKSLEYLLYYLLGTRVRCIFFTSQIKLLFLLALINCSIKHIILFWNDLFSCKNLGIALHYYLCHTVHGPFIIKLYRYHFISFTYCRSSYCTRL